MSSFVSRWVVSHENRVNANDLDGAGVLRDDVIAAWVAEARDAYLDRCPVLLALRTPGGLELRAHDRDLPPGARFGRPQTVVVSVGVTELRPASFTMACRLRTYGSTDDVVANATCAISLVDPATGEACELGDAVRDEFIALEHEARHTN